MLYIPKQRDKNTWERAIDCIKFSLTNERRLKLKKTLKDSNSTLQMFVHQPWHWPPVGLEGSFKQRSLSAFVELHVEYMMRSN